MKKYNILSAACFIALGVYVFIETSGYKQKGIGQQNPALWPQVIAAMMIVCAAVLIIESIVKKDPKETLTQAQTAGENADETEEMIKKTMEEVDSGDLFAELGGGETTEVEWTTPGMKRVYAGVAMVVGFLVVMHFFGMLIGLLLLIPGYMYLMNCKNKKMYVILPVCVVLFVYVFFARIMTITLPSGILF